MLTESPKRQIALLATILGLQSKELAYEICSARSENDQKRAERLLHDCGRGKNSLKNRPAVLSKIVFKFGLRPECMISKYSLEALSNRRYTPIWFLAWTYSGLFPPSASEVGLERLNFARRVHRAYTLHQTFLEKFDHLYFEYATYEDYENNDFIWTSADWWRGLDIDNLENLWSSREKLAKHLFGHVDSITPLASPPKMGWLNELVELNGLYNLPPVYELLQFN